MAVMTIPMYKTLLNSVFTMDTIALGYQSIYCQTSSVLNNQVSSEGKAKKTINSFHMYT